MCLVQELSVTQGDVTKFKQRAMALETQLAVASQRVNVVEGELELAKQEVAAERHFRKTVQVGAVEALHAWSIIPGCLKVVAWPTQGTWAVGRGLGVVRGSRSASHNQSSLP